MRHDLRDRPPADASVGARPVEPAAVPISAAGGQPRPTAAALRLRRPVAVVLSRFPSVTETFILREVMEMERQGQPVRLVPLLRGHPPVVHPEARPWVDRSLYTPFLSLQVLRSNLTALRRPVRYFGLLLRLAASSWTRPRFLLATLALFPKSVHLARVLEREGIRHVHAQFGSHPGTAAFVISTLAETTYSVTLHAHDLFVRSYSPFLGAKLRHADFVRVISSFNRRTVAARFPRVPLDRVHVVHVGVRTREYATPGEESATPEPSAPRILCVAALRDYKGLPVLVDACARLRDEGLAFRVELVGEGPMRAAIEERIARSGLQRHVRLLGALPQEAVTALLRRRPIFVLPSVVLRSGWMEGIPVALMEAMAAGAAAIASRLSGIPELVEHERTGLLVEPGSAGELAAAIRRLATDPAFARRLGESGRAKVRAEFELGTCARRLLELLDQHNPPGPDASRLSELVQRAGGIAGTAEAVGVTATRGGVDASVVQLLVPGDGDPRHLVVKEHVARVGQSRPPGERARHEFEVLARLTRPCTNGSGTLPVPRPVHLEGDGGILVMEACGGRPLDELLRAARCRTLELARARVAMEAAGAWLAAFQERTSGEVGPEEALGLWRRRLEADLERSRNVLPPRLLSRIREKLGEPRPRREVQGVGRHGDFWPGNLLVGEDGVRVLDFEGFGPGLPWEDAAYFLVQAELFFAYPLLRPRFAALRQAFLAGYRQPIVEGDPAWAAFRVGAALQIVAGTSVSCPSRAAALRRVRRLRRLLKQALA